MRADAHGSMLRVGRTASGFLVQVEGRGTLSESPALQEFAVQSLDGPSGPSTVVVDPHPTRAPIVITTTIGAQ